MLTTTNTINSTNKYIENWWLSEIGKKKNQKMNQKKKKKKRRSET